MLTCANHFAGYKHSRVILFSSSKMICSQKCERKFRESWHLWSQQVSSHSEISFYLLDFICFFLPFVCVCVCRKSVWGVSDLGAGGGFVTPASKAWQACDSDCKHQSQAGLLWAGEPVAGPQWWWVDVDEHLHVETTQSNATNGNGAKVNVILPGSNQWNIILVLPPVWLCGNVTWRWVS